MNFKYFNSSSLLLHILRIFFGCIFIFSAVMKIVDLQSFAIALGKFKMLNSWQLDFLTYFFPTIEIVIGLLLIFNIRTNLVSIAATYMLALFTAVIVSKIFEGEEISCGCFGNLTKDTIDYTTVVRNLILILIGFTVTIFYKDRIVKSELIKPPGEIFAKRFYNTFIIFIFFFLGVQTVIFALQNRELKSRLMLLSTDRDVLKKGDLIKPFSGTTLDGKEAEFNFTDNKKTIIFLLSTQCSPCKLNLPNWNNLYSLLKDRKDITLIGVSMDSINIVRDYNRNNLIEFPLYSVTENEFKVNYKAFITPQTYLIDNDKKIINTWTGILDKNRIEDILNGLNNNPNLKQ